MIALLAFLHLDDLAALGEVCTGAAALAALVIASRQILDTRLIARQARVYTYMDRLNAREFVPYVTQTRQLVILRDETPDDRWQTWLTYPLERKQKLLLPLNLFEEMGTMYNAGLLDKALVRRLLASTALAYWEEARWLIERYRTAEQNPRIMEEWERMNDDLEHPRHPWGIGEPWPQTGGLWGETVR